MDGHAPGHARVVRSALSGRVSFRKRHKFARVEQAIGVERLLDAAHDGKRDGVAKPAQFIAFYLPDPCSALIEPPKSSTRS